jgi:hypothetical protein
VVGKNLRNLLGIVVVKGEFKSIDPKLGKRDYCELFQGFWLA